MRKFVIVGLGCVLVVGCASPSPPPKPSPYRSAHTAPLLTPGAHEKELP